MFPPEKVDVCIPEEVIGTWRALLVNNQFDQITYFVEKEYVQAVNNNDSERAALLVAAKQLAASCAQIQSEASFHQEALQKSQMRRNKVAAELKKLLEAVHLEPGTAVSSKPPTFWQRVQNLLRRPVHTNPGEIYCFPKIDKKAEDPQTARPSEAEVAEALPLFPLAQPSPATKIADANSEYDLISEPSARQFKPGSRNLIVYCLGPFRVYQNEHLLKDWNGLKSQMILKYLVANRCKPVAKEILMDVFWPEADVEGARRNLHQAVYSLRQTLKQHDPDFQHVLFENDCYQLNPQLDIWLDFQEFERHVWSGRKLLMAGKKSVVMEEFGIAESLYQGIFMEEDLYDEWPLSERQRLQNLYLEIADQLSEYYLAQEEFAIAITLCQKILRHDKCFEQAYFRLMLCYLAQGQRHLAIRYFLNCREVLQGELGLLPSAETAELYSKLVN